MFYCNNFYFINDNLFYVSSQLIGTENEHISQPTSTIYLMEAIACFILHYDDGSTNRKLFADVCSNCHLCKYYTFPPKKVCGMSSYNE